LWRRVDGLVFCAIGEMLEANGPPEFGPCCSLWSPSTVFLITLEVADWWLCRLVPLVFSRVSRGRQRITKVVHKEEPRHNDTRNTVENKTSSCNPMHICRVNSLDGTRLLFGLDELGVADMASPSYSVSSDCGRGIWPFVERRGSRRWLFLPGICATTHRVPQQLNVFPASPKSPQSRS
jgi:hypothetical protein